MMALPPATQKRVLSGAVRNERDSAMAAGRHHRFSFMGSSNHLDNSTRPIGPSLKTLLSSERRTFTQHSLWNCQMNTDAVGARWKLREGSRSSTPAAVAQPRWPPPRPALLQNPHEGPAQRARGWWVRRAARGAGRAAPGG